MLIGIDSKLVLVINENASLNLLSIYDLEMRPVAELTKQ